MRRTKDIISIELLTSN